jgi:hypothetical protein
MVDIVIKLDAKPAARLRSASRRWGVAPGDAARAASADEAAIEDEVRSEIAAARAGKRKRA